MKHIIVIALTLFLAVFVMAQERNYISTCGKTKTSVKWSEEHKDGKIYLNTIQGNERHEYILDNGYKTESWKIINPVSNTSLTVSLKNGKYSISGKFNGKPISKTVKSKGKPWYQNIAYNAGLTLKNGKSLEYECFRPDNIKLYTMSAVKKGIERFDGGHTVKIEVSLTGFMSAFWSCDYYFDTATLMFVGYKGVNGGPGTPETKISISR
ncbi:MULTISPECIES: hypothetical protein [Bacteroidales]|jgi:hypothetical protein|uniref:DUF4450 domain-containing protein n=7 Tax=Bacteroidales TaxID=171549 RepID=A0A2V1IPA2_9BACT|nr:MULTISPECIES: hypothetical protein [Bacteroidales]ROS90171.1 hypothetical protein EEL36_12405 [Muribaculaceae bacterium Isolate-043 (Harlan)]RXE62107.1 hypothetical protein ED375_06550 [Muribaculaceae bacterium Isolate-004 (NCI)]RXE65125.1 hypothetical protein ED388_08700 [Muribaculaceae bacterium Isolate-007 (NCI)]RXE68034.1 hypothetical protein ED328_08675 [Muribaculaceae bacterium Isolate-001 (NCI)]RXE74299.1 hypothetical protein ED551_03905 [Muribaculaceae bacterium Isolate-013 (NCI)]